MFSLLSAPPSEPQIGCNLSDDNVMLTCTANFQKPLNYSWKITGIATTFSVQDVVIHKGDVDTGGKAACFIEYFEMKKSSEIALSQCFPTYQGNGSGCMCNSKRLNWKIAWILTKISVDFSES